MIVDSSILVSQNLEVLHDKMNGAGIEQGAVGIGFVLGSGLGHLAGMVEGVSIPYGDLLGFPHADVSGHDPQLYIGVLEGQCVAMLGAREHYYENGHPAAMQIALETLKALGICDLILTNAAGSLSPDIMPGELVLINDHINYSGKNPLIGASGDGRFVSMVDAYNPVLRQALSQSALREEVLLSEGIYAWYSGPSFETPAEISMLRMMGVDVVGMSTVPEVILARFIGMRCAAISSITNMAAGLSNEVLSHAKTKEMAPVGAAKLERILRRFLRSM